MIYKSAIERCKGVKVQTKKAAEIHDYYMKLEEILHNIIEEETTELKQQLEQKENIILQLKESSEKEKTLLQKEKQRAVEQAIITQFPPNTECIYFGTIDNTNEAEEKLVKFGHTNNLNTRLQDHRNKYDNFILQKAFRVQNKVEIENLIKNYPKIKKHIRSIVVKDRIKTEIIAYDKTNFTLERLGKHIEDIIHSKTYSIDNFNRITRENQELQLENSSLKENKKVQEDTITNQAIEIQELKQKLESHQKIIDSTTVENQSVYQNVLLPDDELHTKFNNFVDSICIVRPDVEELSINLEGRYRLWSQVKPTKDVFFALKNYLDIRFKQKRVNNNHGYLGIKLKTVEYKKQYANSVVENFIFQQCQFSDCGRILNSVLLKEYQNWKQNVGKPINNNEMKEIKDYLNALPYTLKATVWTQDGNNEGYYGLSLKEMQSKPTIISYTGKRVEKRTIATNELLGTWDSIVKAAFSENISPTKMSQSAKNHVKFGDYYYCTVAAL
jgi:hypothetical protein